VSAAAGDLSEKVEVPGVRPATFKLVGRGPDSYFLYRSSKKLGTARVEPDGEWTARFAGPDGFFEAAAPSGPALLRLVGTYLLAGEARAAASRPIEETHPELRVKGKKSAEEKLSIEIVRRSEERRVEKLDALLAELSEHVTPRKGE
jgi:hypothetical protein